MSRMVASWDCLFRLLGGRRSIPLEISLGLIVVVVSHVSDKRAEVRTNLKTLTDHPRFVGSPLKVSSSEARVSEESALESVT